MLSVSLGEINLDNPIIPASGTFGFGHEFSAFYDINILGSLSIKGTTVLRREGNMCPRVAECESGMLNSIGLQNPGAKDVLKFELTKLKKVYSKKVFANVCGNTIDEYVQCAKILSESELVCAIELNVSCPNVEKGGINFGTDITCIQTLVSAVCNSQEKPVFVKLTPNVTNIVEIAVACEKAGASGLVLINTLIGMKIDIKTKKPVLRNKKGGLSGPAIKPIAIRMIYDVYKSVSIPIIGCGGVCCAEDVIEMMLAGASAVQIGTANLIDPNASKNIIENLCELLKQLKIQNISSIIGGAHE